MPHLISLAWRNLRANPLRFVFGVVAVTFGVGATIASDVITQSMRAALLKNDDMVIMMEGMLDQFNSMSLFVGAVIMLAAGFLIFNAFSMSVGQRRQQIGGLRALGMTRSQVFYLILSEGLVIAALGVVLGLFLGPAMGQGATAFLRESSRDLLAFEQTAPNPNMLFFAALLGAIATLMALWVPARQAAHATPLDALRTPIISENSRIVLWRPLLGALIIGLVFAHLLIAPTGAWAVYPLDAQFATLFSLLWFAALVLLLPTLIHVISLLGAGPWRNVIVRLVADNLGRARRRVIITVFTMAFGLTVITGLAGFFEFSLNKLIVGSMQADAERELLFVSRLDVLSGWGNMTKSFGRGILLSPQEQEVIRQTVAGRADWIDTYYIVVPELSFIGDNFFSYLTTDTEAFLRYLLASDNPLAGEGSNLRLLLADQTCGVFITPLIASKNKVEVGDRFVVSAANGPVTCVVGGIGSTFSGASTIITTDKSRFGATNPILTQIVPYRRADTSAIIADLEAQAANYPFYVTTIRQMVDLQSNNIDVVLLMFNILLVLAVAAAALGIVNTTVISILERQPEIRLLRSVGATRRQVRGLIIGEAALMGLLGGVFGVLAGVGFVVVFATSYGGSSLGVRLDLWPAALDSAAFALRSGLLGLAAAPFISVLVAWWPARNALKRSLIA